jgi:hypothetical protein
MTHRSRARRSLSFEEARSGVCRTHREGSAAPQRRRSKRRAKTCLSAAAA